MFGTIRTEYSSGITSFGNFPGVSLKLNGFSAAMTAGNVTENSTARKRNRERTSRIKREAAKSAFARFGFPATKHIVLGDRDPPTAQSTQAAIVRCRLAGL